MNSKQYRMNEFISAANGRSLIIDTSCGLTLGVQAGLENLAAAVTPLLSLCDGIVASPGQVRAVPRRGQQDAALLARADWTNALRGKTHTLPPTSIQYIPLLQPAAGLELGVNGLVVHFLLGHDEQIEAACLKNCVQLALQGTAVGMPLIVDVQPIGPRVVLRSKAIELGVSYALESGANGIAIPWPGVESFTTIMTMARDTAVWVKPESFNLDDPALADALELGAVGFWLDERVFLETEPAAIVAALAGLIHGQEA
jgi:DhnA family fructose-bisphosphate aldolase class Ia